MRIDAILDHIDSGHMALPEFQRGYVWNRDQVRGLLDSLYRRHPVGSLLVWATQTDGAPHRGPVTLAPGIVKLLLDGQQRITSLYGIIRGRPPRFFDGKVDTFTGLHFNLHTEEFSFYQPVKMKGDPAWIDVSKLMKHGMGPIIGLVYSEERLKEDAQQHLARLNAIHTISQIDFHIDEVTGEDKTIDVVVDIFNRVNSGGTKLSKGDLALAKICASWPEARGRMKESLAKWRREDYHFDLDWLLRCVNTVTTGEARFRALHTLGADTFQEGLLRTVNYINTLLNAVSSRLGLDHDRVLFGRYGFPVMARYLEERGGRFQDAEERDLTLFWYLQSAMWGRFSGSTESVIDRDLEILAKGDGLEGLIRELRLWRGGLRVQPDHFGGWSTGARFYPMLYLLSRTGSARDWGTGLEIKASLLGHMSSLEVHHIFPKAYLYRHKYPKAEVNAVANFCFLTKDTNLQIGDRSPSEYFRAVEEKHPGALESQWIPMDSALWSADRYPAFLEARRQLLAEAANGFLLDLLHGVTEVLEPIEDLAPASPEMEVTEEPPDALPVAPAPPVVAPTQVPGGIETAEEEEQLRRVNEWVVRQGLPEGELPFELVDQETGDVLAYLDLAWPNGLQEGLSQAVALLLDEGSATLSAASQAGFRHFTDVVSFAAYVKRDILALNGETAAD